MSECTMKDHLHSIAVGIGLAVVLFAIGGGVVFLSWATSTNILNSAPGRTDQLMMERSAYLAAANANSPAARPGH